METKQLLCFLETPVRSLLGDKFLSLSMRSKSSNQAVSCDEENKATAPMIALEGSLTEHWHLMGH
ncbi:unnamed protein product, partial [Eruca vesicaria subsp. sativa]|nr:unnamed protein product [Eruca vesicaria subsp. sativa]